MNVRFRQRREPEGVLILAGEDGSRGIGPVLEGVFESD
jgi:hypothetical protein